MDINTLSFLVLLATILVSTRAQSLTPCVGKYPLGLSVIGKEAYESGGCSPGGQQSSTALKIHSWGLYFSPLFYNNGGCREEIVISYTKSDRPAMLYYRPLAEPKYFANTHPQLFKKYQNREFVQFPCQTVPVQKVHVWNNRVLFVSLVNKAARGVEYIRNLDCSAPEHYGNPNAKFSWTELRQRIADDRVPTAALTFLHTLAYSNFFCV